MQLISKKSLLSLVMSLLILICCTEVIIGQQQSKEIKGTTGKLDAASKGRIVEEVAKLITEKYVFPDIGKKIADHIHHRFKEKAYDQITSLNTFTRELTKDVQSVNNDAHLGVVERRRLFTREGSNEDMWKKLYLKRAPFQNYGFKNVDRLLGNVGCIVLDELAYVEIDGKNIGGETAKAVMKVISNCYALIIDLRDNFGGRDEMAILILSYFFKKPEHILTQYNREQGEKEIWTLAEAPGDRLVNIPLYVLTSRHTVSGGEMFAYALKNRKRATIIGEKTRGAAHKTHLHSIQDFKIDVAIPYSTIIDPLTGTDWEGKGVEPDIAVPSAKAMNVAYSEALKKILQSDVDKTHRYEMEWALMEAKARLNPVTLDAASLQEYVGVYGKRKITSKNGSLVYQREGKPAYKLEPMSKNLFSFVDKSMFYVRISFGRDKSGAVDKIILLYDTGQRDESKKTGN